MGREYVLCCKECNKESSYFIGVGRIGSKRAAEYLRRDVLKGKHGEKAKELLMEFEGQDCYPDPSNKIYCCDCGYWESSHPLDIIKYVSAPWPHNTDDTEEQFYDKKVLVKRHYRHCPRCNKRMKKMKYILEKEKVLELLKCPHCGGNLFVKNHIMWD